MNSIIESIGGGYLLLPIIIPAVFAAISAAAGKNDKLRTAFTVIGSVLNLLVCVPLFIGKTAIRTAGFMGGFSLSFELAATEYSSLFIFLAACAFAVITLYCTAWLNGKKYARSFMSLIFISLAMINGAFLSNSLGIMLFFWEGLLCTLFALLMIENTANYKTAVKALTLSGFADLLLMLGLIITAKLAGTFRISEIRGIPVSGLGILGFVCVMAGSLGKAGAMPFHSWIPSAANDSKLPFMAFFPGAMEKLVGLYFAVRVITSLYAVSPGSAPAIAVMTVGAVTLVFAVAMALVQKDMKKLLSYHAISQVGYMILGIGSATPVGIAGGMSHMLNNVIYKSALFMVAGIIEQKIGTTDLRKFSGLGKKMPVTMVCFTVCGLSIAGVPPFNGFFSKELIFDAALESECGALSYVFYAAALLGAFMTAVSFLKMGRAAFSGKLTLPDGVDDVDEKGLLLKLPACIMAVLCVFFGIFNTIPVDGWFRAAANAREKLGGFPSSIVLVAVSVCVLLLALADHAYGCKKTGKPINAADHIHYAPGLKSIYALAEKGVFDPYNWLTAVMNGFAFVCMKIEAFVSFVYDKAVPGLVTGAGNLLHRADNGSLSRYIAGVGIGVAAVAVMFILFVLYH